MGNGTHGVDFFFIIIKMDKPLALKKKKEYEYKKEEENNKKIG